MEEQRRPSEDFKDQMNILVSNLLERDSNVERFFGNVEKQLNRHRFALNKAEDQVSSGPSANSDVILTLPIVPSDE